MKSIKIVLAVALIIICLTMLKECKVEVDTDTSKFEKTIDSLNKQIELDKQKISTYDSAVAAQIEKVNKLTKKLKETSDKALKEQKQHEKDLNRLNSLPCSDIASEFTNAFQ